MPADFLDLLQRLRASGAEFVIAGGVAANLHGSNRVTFDVEVVPSLASGSWQQTIDFLWSLGARPRIPEPREAVRDVANIRRWIEEKGMLALNMRTPDGGVEVDLLVAESDHYSELRDHAVRIALRGQEYLVASIDDLILMKRRAGRPIDLQDVETLEAIRQRQRP